VAIGMLFIFDSFRRFGTSLFRAREKMENEAFINILTQIVIVVGGFVALYFAKTPESLATAYALGAGIGLLIAAYFLKDNLKQLFSGFDRTLVPKIVKAAWPLSLAAIFGMLLVNIDTVMIGWFRTAESVGYYSAAQKPIALLYILPTLIVGGFFPALARFAKKNDLQFRKVFEKALGLIAAIGFPVAAGIMLTSGEIVELVYGAGYLASSAPFRILAITVLTAFPISIIIHGVFAYNKQSSLVPLWIAGAVLNIALNLFLIPRSGITGAAWASVITQLIINSLIWMRMRKINEFKILDKLPPILLATLMMTVAVIIAKLISLHIFIIIPLGALTYLASLRFSGVNIFADLKRS